MKEIELFYLTNCPYCRNAEKAIEELSREEPALGTVPIRRIEESLEPELTEGRDYYYVPTIFLEGRKLYECHPGDNYTAIQSAIRCCLEEALRA